MDFSSLCTDVLDKNSIKALRKIADETSVQSNLKMDIEILNKIASGPKEGKDIALLKEAIRNYQWPVDDSIRQNLWRNLALPYKDQDLVLLYTDMAKEIFGDTYFSSSLPSFIDPAYIIRYYLSIDGKNIAEKILQVIKQAKPDITYCPLLYPLISLFLHYETEEVSFGLAMKLLNDKQNYLSQSRSDHIASSFLVMKLCKKYAKNAYSQLQKELKEHEDLESMFQNWPSWIFKGLPFSYVIRVIDCFLLDKKKVLYRVVIALLILYGKYAGKPSPDDVGTYQRLLDFFQNIPVTSDKVLKIAYSLRGFSDKYVQQQFIKVQMILKSQINLSERSWSADRIPQSNSSYHLEVNSAAQPIVKQLKMESISRTRSVGVVALGNFKSSIITPEQMSTIWSWLPLRISMLQPEVIYSSNEHGVCLTAFYMAVGIYEPTVIVLKTTNDEVFGAYCSSSWNSRNSCDCNNKKYTYFGTGETFLFTIVPEIKRYQWVGCDAMEEVAHSAKLFMAADHAMINVGAGNGQGLLLDEQLLNGRTEHCDTFDNDPLCSTKDFQCKVVEVIAFK